MDNQQFQSTNYTNQSVQTSPATPKSNLLIIIVLCLTVINLFLSILCIVMVSQINSNSSTSEEDEGVDTVLPATSSACDLPTNVQDISYLSVYYDKGDNAFSVDPGGFIDYYTDTTDSKGNAITTEQTIETDTSSILQQVFDNGINDFHSYSLDQVVNNEGVETAKYNWRAQIDTTDFTSCEASGNGSSPEWFNTLVNQINAIIKE